jgi:hypothetical protein
MTMSRPYLHFRPTQEFLDEVHALSLEVGLTVADITRQLCMNGLDYYRQGGFTFKMPGMCKSPQLTGSIDQRSLRKTGLLISNSKGGKPVKRRRGGGVSKLETMNRAARPEHHSARGVSNE